jgi:prophage regulatory protein
MHVELLRNDPSPWLLSPRETRRRLGGIKAQTLRALVKTGALPPPVLVDGQQRWPEPVVREFADSDDFARLMVAPSPPLPACGLVRLRQIVGDPNALPPVPAIVPVAASTWWAGVKSGRYPQPVKTLGGRITAWRVEDIRRLCAPAPTAAEKSA